MIVKDKASTHNFHFYRPGDVNERTGYSEQGRYVWRLDLQPGVYTAQCDWHSSTMKLTVQVT